MSTTGRKKKRYQPDEWFEAYTGLVDAIEEEVKRRELSYYRLSLESGVAQSIFTRLKGRDEAISTENLLRILITLFGSASEELTRGLTRH
jgi:hypothetical protein